MDRYLVRPGKPAELAARDPSDTSEHPELDKESSRVELDGLTTRLGELQALLAAGDHHRMLVVLQAMDTGGKDGTIRNVFIGTNPQGVHVMSFKAPTEAERARDYLWRIHAHVPRAGEIGVFNRSHYEDVLVVRVRDLVPVEQWKRRYDHIVAFEQLLADEGTTIVKLFLHISKDEQRERLQARIDNPQKHWKFEPNDLDERRHWDSYMAAYEDALTRTSTVQAPWYVVPADRKWYRNLIVAEILVDTLEGLHLTYPEPDPELKGLIVE